MLPTLHLITLLHFSNLENKKTSAVNIENFLAGFLLIGFLDDTN